MTQVDQRSLGDCGSVSCIGATAEHPNGHNLIFSMIYPCVYNPLGLYSIRMINEQGEIRYLLIDDLLPNEGYSYQEGTRFWYFLLEKAFAKLEGGYSLLGVRERIGLADSSNIWIDDKNKEEIWKKFLKTYQEDYLTTYNGTGASTIYLVAGHAYAVVDAAEYYTGEEVIRLIRLHNPWNYVPSKYNAPYRPGSSDWNNIPKEIRKNLFQIDRFKLDDKDKTDTTFWILYEDFIKDIGKYSYMYLREDLPEVLKSIAQPVSIQKD